MRLAIAYGPLRHPHSSVDQILFLEHDSSRVDGKVAHGQMVEALPANMGISKIIIIITPSQ